MQAADFQIDRYAGRQAGGQIGKQANRPTDGQTAFRYEIITLINGTMSFLIITFNQDTLSYN